MDLLQEPRFADDLNLASAESKWERTAVGMPRYHDQPVLLLMYRTIANYNDVKMRCSHDGPFEVTQLINSFLAVVAHPWDQLLDKKVLEGLKLEERRFRECGFPAMTRFQDESGKDADDAFNMLRLLRNSFAHGNMELLDRKQLRKLRPTGALPRVHEREIAGLRIWNTSKTGVTTWSTVLDVTEIEAALDAMKQLCEKRSLWKEDVRLEHERREQQRKQTA